MSLITNLKTINNFNRSVASLGDIYKEEKYSNNDAIDKFGNKLIQIDYYKSKSIENNSKTKNESIHLI